MKDYASGIHKPEFVETISPIEHDVSVIDTITESGKLSIDGHYVISDDPNLVTTINHTYLVTSEDSIDLNINSLVRDNVKSTNSVYMDNQMNMLSRGYSTDSSVVNGSISVNDAPVVTMDTQSINVNITQNDNMRVFDVLNSMSVVDTRINEKLRMHDTVTFIRD